MVMDRSRWSPSLHNHMFPHNACWNDLLVIYWGLRTPFFMDIFALKVVKKADPEFSTYKDDLVEWIYKYKDRNEGVKLSNQHGWQSESGFYMEEESFNPFWEDLWRLITETTKEYSTGIELGEMIRQGYGIKLLNLWISVNPPGAYNKTHVHPGALLSGVIWIDFPEDSGDFFFRNPNEMNSYCLSSSVAKVKPTEGECLLFPAFIPHDVSENESDGDRISISFNLDID